jgi:hypothetical protein
LNLLKAPPFASRLYEARTGGSASPSESRHPRAAKRRIQNQHHICGSIFSESCSIRRLMRSVSL